MSGVRVALTLILPKNPWGLLRGAEKTPEEPPCRVLGPQNMGTERGLRITACRPTPFSVNVSSGRQPRGLLFVAGAAFG